MEGRAAWPLPPSRVTEASSRTGPHGHLPLLLGSMRDGPDNNAQYREAAAAPAPQRLQNEPLGFCDVLVTDARVQ